MKATWLLALAACGAGDPCDDVAATCITVHVTSSSVGAIDTLELDIAYAGFHATAASSSSPTDLPLVTAVELGGAAMPVTVGIVGAGKRAGAVVGTGYAATTELAVGQHVQLELPIALRADACIRGTYCGTDKLDGEPNTLYLCHPGGAEDPDGTPEANVPTFRGLCVNGCIRNTSDDDVCSGGNLMATQGNTYCGGHKLDGDPETLYRCDATGKPIQPGQDCLASGKHCLPQGADSDTCR